MNLLTRHSLFLYCITLFQGMSFSIVPGASYFLMGKSGMQFSTYEYGVLFILMVFGTIFTLFFGDILTKSRGPKPILIISLMLNAIALAFFGFEKWLFTEIIFSYPLFLLVLFFLGSGFGAYLSTIHHFQKTPESEPLPFLGIGCAISPILFLVCFRLNLWYMTPIFLSVVSFFLGLAALFVLPNAKKQEPNKMNQPSFLFLSFLLMALVYGFLETTFGNWGAVYLYQNKKLSIEVAIYGLSLFWVSFSLTKMAFHFLAHKTTPKSLCFFLAPTIVTSVLFLYFSRKPAGNLLFFFLIGVICSGLHTLISQLALKYFPQEIGQTRKHLTNFYMAGYGLASWGIGATIKHIANN